MERFQKSLPKEKCTLIPVSLLYPIVKHRRTKFDNAFYVMVYYLALADCYMLSLFFFVLVPCVLANDYVYGTPSLGYNI